MNVHPDVAEILATNFAVIPAKAGIHLLGNSVDSRLRGNDRRHKGLSPEYRGRRVKITAQQGVSRFFK